MITKFMPSHGNAKRSAFYYLHDAPFQPTVERVAQVEAFGFDASLLADFELGDPQSHRELVDRVAFEMKSTAEAAHSGPVDEFVVPMTISVHPDDRLSAEQWSEITQRMIQHLGLEGHEVLMARHTDKEHEHIHLMINRVSVEGYMWDEGYSHLKSGYLARALEREYDLKELEMKRAPHLALTKDEYRFELEAQAPPLIEVARGVVPAALERADSWGGFSRSLGGSGLWVEPGRFSGAVVTNGNLRVKLSRVIAGRDPLGQIEARLGATLEEWAASVGGDLSRDAAEYALEGLAYGQKSLAEAAQQVLDKLVLHELTFTTEQIDQALVGYPYPAAVLKSAVLGDARMVPLGNGRFTTAEHLVLEDRFTAEIDVLRSRSGHRIPEAKAAVVLEKHPELSVEQRSVIEALTQSDDLLVVQGLAGVGKTHMLGVVREAYAEAGYQLIGLAPTHRAVSEMRSGAGLEDVQTLASFLASGRAGELTKQSVLVLDEGSMVGLRDFDQVARAVGVAEAQLVVIGDRGQLSPVSAGAPFRELAPDVELSGIRRQRVDWMKDATVSIAQGRVRPALEAYAGHGHVHFQATSAQALARLRDDVVASIGEHPEATHLALAYTKADRFRLNRMIHESLLEAGELSPVGWLEESGVDLAVGERVVFARTDTAGDVVLTIDGEGAGVAKGDLGRVVGADEAARTVDVALDSGRTVRFAPEAAKNLWQQGYAANALEPSFAVNVHRVQAASVDRVFMLADPRMRQEAFYVEASRHRDSLEVYVDQSAYDPPALKVLSELESEWRDSREDLARDLGAAVANDWQPGEVRSERVHTRAVVVDDRIARDVNREVRRRLGHKEAFVRGEPVTFIDGSGARRFGSVRSLEGNLVAVSLGGQKVELDVALVEPAYALSRQQLDLHGKAPFALDRLHQQVDLKLTHRQAETLRSLSEEGLGLSLWAQAGDFPAEARREFQWESLAWHLSRKTEDPAIRSLANDVDLAHALERTEVGRRLEDVKVLGSQILEANGYEVYVSARDELEQAMGAIARVEAGKADLERAQEGYTEYLGAVFKDPEAARLHVDHARQTRPLEEVRQALNEVPEQFGALKSTRRARIQAEQGSYTVVDVTGAASGLELIEHEAKVARSKLPKLQHDARLEEQTRKLFGVRRRRMSRGELATMEQVVHRRRVALQVQGLTQASVASMVDTAYVEPAAVMAKIEAYAAEKGYGAAAARLERSPEVFGELAAHGRSLSSQARALPVREALVRHETAVKELSALAKPYKTAVKALEGHRAGALIRLPGPGSVPRSFDQVAQKVLLKAGMALATKFLPPPVAILVKLGVSGGLKHLNSQHSVDRNIDRGTDRGGYSL